MNKSILTNPEVKQAITALENGDRDTWYSIFVENPTFTDDGNSINFRSFFDKVFDEAQKFVYILKVENEGMDIVGNFHAGQWGTLLVFFKFNQNDEKKFDRLDVGMFINLFKGNRKYTH